MNLGLGAVLTPIKAAYRQVEFRRQVKLTVEHKNVGGTRTWSAFTGSRSYMKDVYVITNKSPKRDLVVNRVWLDTTPTVEIRSPELPVRIAPEDRWSREVPAHTVPGTHAEVERLGRCQLSPDDKIIKSRQA